MSGLQIRQAAPKIKSTAQRCLRLRLHTGSGSVGPDASTRAGRIAQGARLGLVTSRKAANAVGRNRVRRHVREAFRLHRERFPARHDVVVIAKEGAAALDSAAVRGEILGALERGAAPKRRPPAQGATP